MNKYTKSTRRDFTKSVFAVSAIAGMTDAVAGAATLLNSATISQAAKKRRDKRPNLLFVFSDEHRWCSLPFTQMPEVHAPTFSQLAKEGISFDRCVSNNPICVPYRNMLLTGMWPQETGLGPDNYVLHGVGVKQAGEVLAKSSIANVFNEAGYTTGYVGKWHLLEDSVYSAGFNYHKNWFFGDDHWKTKYRDVPTQEGYKEYAGYNAVGMTDQSLEFIQENADRDKPFMLMVSWNPPHWRWDDAPGSFLKLYPQGEIPFRPNVTEPYKKGDRLSQYQNYLAHISAVDQQMKRLLDELKRLQIDGNTIVIYTSDHGSSFGSQGLWSKRTGNDESNHVPLLVRWPGHVPAGKRDNTLVGAIDLHPTLCGLAGIPVPSYCHGQDLSKALLGKPCISNESQYIFGVCNQEGYIREMRNPGGHNWALPYRGVYTGEYTYMIDIRGNEFLYDNVKDIYQMNNLADEPATKTKKAELITTLKSWLVKAEDPYIPAEFHHLAIPERLQKLNEHYAWQNIEPYFLKYKTNKAAAQLAECVSEQQKGEIRALFDSIFDRGSYARIYGIYKDIGKLKKDPDEPASKRLARLEQELLIAEHPLLERFRDEAGIILN